MRVAVHGMFHMYCCVTVQTAIQDGEVQRSTSHPQGPESWQEGLQRVLDEPHLACSCNSQARLPLIACFAFTTASTALQHTTVVSCAGELCTVKLCSTAVNSWARNR